MYEARKDIYLKKSIKLVHLDAIIPTILESLNHHQLVELKVSGDSMRPTLKNNLSIVGLEQYQGTLEKHHIYFYMYKGKYFLHRYLKTKNQIHYFQGDALYTYETFMDDAGIIASLVYIKHNNKKVNPYTFLSNITLNIRLCLKRTKMFIRKLVKPHDA